MTGGLIVRLTLIAWTFLVGAISMYGQGDTVLYYQEFLDNILRYHPLAKQADLKIQLGEARRVEAKGNLDPQLVSGLDQKQFDDKLYYNNFQAKLKLPTPLGIQVVGGYEQTDGLYVNPENTTNDLGLWQLGVEVDVLQGLFVNERRTALQQAAVFMELTRSERQIMLNDLVYKASAAYLYWQQYAYFDDVWKENVDLASAYFDNTRQSYVNGEKTAMDTLEAFIAFQEAITNRQKNELELIKARLYVENHLWFNDLPVTLQPNTRPEYFQNQIFPLPAVFVDTALTTHPVILAAVNKLSILEIEQRLKREALKPQLTVKYNPLLATSNNLDAPGFSINDYKFGVHLAMPLLWRSERGDIQSGEVKIQDTQFDLEYKRNELQNKIENSWQQQRLLQDQVDLWSANVNNYKRLMEGENEKFRLGESSVFLLNKRQEKYIEGQMKWIGTYIQRQLEVLNFLYYSNQLVGE